MRNVHQNETYYKYRGDDGATSNGRPLCPDNIGANQVSLQGKS
jgi:hypothetical protein